MSRFRLILLVSAVLAVVSAIYGSFTRTPELPPEPAKIDVRGPETMAQNAERDQWVMAKQAAVTSAGTAITLDTEWVTFFVGVLTALTLLLALLSRYLIMPMISKQIDRSMKDLDRRFITRQDLVIVLLNTNNDKTLLHMSEVWKAENR